MNMNGMNGFGMNPYMNMNGMGMPGAMGAPRFF
jgi:hypothetical protein